MSRYGRLCRVFGIRESFIDDRKELVHASEEAIKNVLELLTSGHGGTGGLLSSASDAALEDLYNSERVRRLNGKLSATTLAWDGELSAVRLTLRADERQRKFRLRVRSPDTEHVKEFDLDDCTSSRRREVRSERFLTYIIPWNLKLPFGYYSLDVEVGHERCKSLVISSPRRIDPPHGQTRSWGAFAPLYALRSESDWGIGSFAELDAAQRFVRGERRRVFSGTLPLLASASNSSDFDPSPYSPSSRLFWNEIYLDVPAIAQDLAREGILRMHSNIAIPFANDEELLELRERKYVDYAAVYRRKFKEIFALSDVFFESNGATRQEFMTYLSEHPDVWDYARYRSTEPDVTRFHVFCQFQIHRQLKRIKDNEGAGLYLDFPIGVSTNGFDSCTYPEVFLKGAALGAPPDSFYKEGQNWGTLPFHPYGIKSDDYSYFIRAVKNHLKYSTMLRLDHAMGLHRVYVIPEGAESSQGAYVNYSSEDLYAILCFEATQHQAEIVGEDLGTVPEIVRERMSVHGFQRMWVYELETTEAFDLKQAKLATAKIKADSLAAINTHDLPQLAAFLAQRGLEVGVGREYAELLLKLSALLAKSGARNFILNLEDLWPKRSLRTRRADERHELEKAAFVFDRRMESPATFDEGARQNRGAAR